MEEAPRRFPDTLLDRNPTNTGATFFLSVVIVMSMCVLLRCYGGDISRKKKLIQKQAAGKKRMKAVGKVNVPQEAFKAMLSINDS